MRLWQFLGRRRPSAGRTPQRRRYVPSPVERLEDRLTPNSTYHPLAAGPFSQNWSSPSFPGTDDWSAVPSIIGYRGDGLAPAAGTNPATVLAPGTGTDQAVTPGVTEVPIFYYPPYPVGAITQFTGGGYAAVGLRGSTAAQAPNLVLHLNTQGTRNVRLSFELNDAVLWPSLTVQPLAVQYRVGGTGNYTNIPYAFVNDAAIGPHWGEYVTPVTLTLPAEAWDQAQVQVRLILTDAVDAGAPTYGDDPTSDHWILVDDIQVTATNAPPSVQAFTIATTSTLTLSGSVAGGAIQQQGAGSLSTTYSGNINVLWNRTTNQISFLLPGTAANAANSGTWRPDIGGADCSGAACPPANYGAQATILIFITGRIALRNVVGALSTAAPLAVSGSGPWTFASGQTMHIVNGFADYNAGLAGEGREDIGGESGPNMAGGTSSIANVGGTLRLTVPIAFTYMDEIEGEPVVVNLNGSFIANEVASPLVLDLNGAATGRDSLAGFIRGGPAVSVHPNLTLTRSPLANVLEAVVTLTNRPDGVAESLAVSLGGSGLTLTSYDPGTGRLVLSGSAPLSTYEAVLRTLTYNNTALNPSTATRLIEVQTFDGTYYSQTRTAGVTVGKPNNAPTTSTPIGEVFSIPASTSWIWSTGTGTALTVSDPDPGDIIQVSMSTWTGGVFTLGTTAGITIVSGGEGEFFMTIRGTVAAINTALDGLTFTPPTGFVGDDFLNFVVTDVIEREATGTIASMLTFRRFYITMV
jgi:hypothetical protein